MSAIQSERKPFHRFPMREKTPMILVPFRFPTQPAAGGSCSFGESRTGSDFFLGAESPVLRWLSLGGEAALVSFRGLGPGEVTSIPEETITIDRARVLMLAGSVRCETPVKYGPSMFLLTQTGFALVRFGDRHVTSGFIPPPGTFSTPGERELVWCTAVAAGFRVHLPQPWPSIEVSVKRSALIGPDVHEVASSGFALFY